MDDKEPMKDEADPDFYFENGLMVFTAKYLLKRGYCCKNGCRHCPYGFNREAQNEEGDPAKQMDDP